MKSPYRQLLPAVLLGALAWPAGARAATMIDGGDIGGQVWTAAGSPYIVGKVKGDPIVPAGQELRIEAGATVLFSGPEDLTLLVQGTLNVNGTATAPVTMQGELGDTVIAWRGVEAARLGSAVVRITGAVIRNAKEGVKIYGGDARVDRTTFENCGFGLSVTSNNNDYAFDSLAFQKNTVGFECLFCGAVKLTNAVAQGNAARAAILYGDGAVTIINSTFDANGHGVDIWPSPETDATATVDLVNTILSNNREAMELDLRGGPAVLTVTHSTFWGNRDANLLVKPAGVASYVITAGAVAPTGTGNAVADPKYLSATDLHLSASSPCVDSGRAAGAPNHDLDQSGRPIEGDGVPDTDGSTFDRGAYEFGATGGAGSGGSSGAAAAGGGAAAAGGGAAAAGSGAAGGAGGRSGVGVAGGEAAGRGGIGGVGGSGGGGGGGAGIGNDGQTGGMIGSAGNDSGGDARTGIGGGAGGSAATPDAAADPHPTAEGGGCGCRLVAGSEGATGSVVALALLGILLGRRKRF